MGNKQLPNDFVLAITYNCNSKCRMCNIWKADPLPVLDLAEYNKLPNTIKEINLSGGEPFLHQDIVKIVQLLNKKNPQVRIIISSNGFATELIRKKMQEILKIKPDIGVGISLDGIGNVHDEVRGIPGGYEKVLNTIQALKDLGVKNLRLAYTAGDYNIEQMNKVYQVSRDLNVQMTLAAVHNAENYFNIADNKITKIDQFKLEFSQVIKKELAGFNLKRWARAYFTYALFKFLETGQRVLPNYSGHDNVFIDPQGNVFPADISAHNMGNLKDFSSFEELYNSPKAQKAIKAEKECQNWMICTARSAIKRHPFEVLFWVIKSKLLGLKI